MGSTEDPKLVTTTVHAYDTAQLRSLFKSQLMGVGMMGFMHLYLKYTNPLLIQSIIPLKGRVEIILAEFGMLIHPEGAFESNLFKIHVWGEPAAGELKRPWKAGGGMMAMMGGAGGAAEIKTDRASIEAAERAGRGGAKEVRQYGWLPVLDMYANCSSGMMSISYLGGGCDTQMCTTVNW